MSHADETADPGIEPGSYADGYAAGLRAQRTAGGIEWPVYSPPDAPPNPLVMHRPCDTLSNVECALTWLRTRTAIDFGGEPSDELVDKMGLGRSLLFQVIEQAIEYEGGRVVSWRAPGGAS